MKDLEGRLRRIEVAFPETPPLVDAVAGRLEPRPERRFRRRVALAVALAVLATLVAVMVTPGARATLLDWLGLRGAVVVRVDELPPADRYARLGLGERVSLEEARRAVPFALVLPADRPAPAEAYLDLGVPGGAVSVVLCCDPELLLTQVPGAVTPVLQKLVAGAAAAERVEVAGAPGIWVEGEHLLLMVGVDRTVRELRARLAGNTLLWERDGLVVRLEGPVDRDAALELARTVR